MINTPIVGRTIEVALVASAPVTIPVGGSIPFNVTTLNTTRVRDCRGCSQEVCRLIPTSGRVRIRARAVYNVDVNINSAASATDVLTVTDNEGQDKSFALTGSTQISCSLLIEENRGSISVINNGTAPLVLTPTATNTALPLADMRIVIGR